MKEIIYKLAGIGAIVSLLLLPFTKGATLVPLFVCVGVIGIMVILEI